MAVTRVFGIDLDAKTYRRHSLHAEERVWVEKNCYVDVWIEAVHALGLDPMAMLGFTAAVDFEGDQFTFFKPKHEELYELYGLDVQEMNPWRSLAEHVAVQLDAGKLVATEADAWFLPDTSGTDYRTTHTKTTIIVNDFDLEAKKLGYFHNASYHELSGEDFDNMFRVGFEPDPKFMPFFAETIKTRGLVNRSSDELRAMATALLIKHAARRPSVNPVQRFGARLGDDVERLGAEGLATYHAWAFATIRQLGAAMELLALHLRWLGQEHAVAADSFDVIVNGMKTMIMKGARAVSSKKPLDASALFADMSAAWQRGMDALPK